jgi:hypothetical protein
VDLLCCDAVDLLCCDAVDLLCCEAVDLLCCEAVDSTADLKTLHTVLYINITYIYYQLLLYTLLPRS